MDDKRNNNRNTNDSEFSYRRPSERTYDSEPSYRRSSESSYDSEPSYRRSSERSYNSKSSYRRSQEKPYNSASPYGRSQQRPYNPASSSSRSQDYSSSEYDEDSYEREARERRRRREAMRRKQKQKKMRRLIICILVALLILVAVIVIAKIAGKEKTPEPSTEQTGQKVDIRLAISEKLVASYYYDEAIKLLSGHSDETSGDGGEGDGNSGDGVAKDGSSATSGKYADTIKQYEALRDSCVAADVNTVPHVFFHSLLNDSRGFDANVVGKFVAQDNGCWMCSTGEFKAIIQQLYEAGYVLISLHDLVKTDVDAEGKPHYTPNDELMLPPDKKPLILSEDDLSYYHSYDGQGIASKLVLDENGEVKCEYINEAGETLVGDYDVVPILDTFIKEHPDFSYRGAKEIIALTGYNGVFGYRTDSVYQTRDPANLDDVQQEFLNSHPDFNYEEEVRQATEIANALKETGYEFASHTWGHRHADQISASELITDNDRWVATVEPIVGKTDTLIYAHGGDIGGNDPYDETNEKYVALKNAGYSIFCNVDASSPYWIQITENFVRTARVDLDGYFLYNAMTEPDGRRAQILSYLGIHDIDSFFDSSRITPVVIP